MSGEESKGQAYPLKRVLSEGVKHVKFKGWIFAFVNDAPLAKSVESANIQSYLRGVQQVPDMFYGMNRLYLINSERDFVYCFSPLDALQFCLNNY